MEAGVRAGWPHTLALLPVGVKALHNERKSPQPGTEVQSTLVKGKGIVREI